MASPDLPNQTFHHHPHVPNDPFRQHLNQLYFQGATHLAGSKDIAAPQEQEMAPGSSAESLRVGSMGAWGLTPSPSHLGLCRIWAETPTRETELLGTCLSESFQLQNTDPGEGGPAPRRPSENCHPACVKVPSQL